MTVTIDDIRAAADMLEGQIVRTPTVRSRTLSEITGAQVTLKFENLQYTGSFKDRGAFVKLSSLTDAERAAGIVAASAGNHAQGVAYHAQRLGIPATIVMPTATPFNKVRAVQRFGAKIVLHGEGLHESADRARELEAEHGFVFVHPYDDEKIVTGQGTMALEMLADAPYLETLVIPIGGGGLIAGGAIAAKAVKPDIEIVGVESELYPSMFQAVKHMPPTSGGQSIAEGIAVKNPGGITKAIIEQLVDDLLLVGERGLEQAVQMLIEIEKTVAEGAGAATLAALLANPERFTGREVGIVVSGGNIDSRMLANILMRGLVREGRMVKIRVEISDQPGVLARVAQVIGETGGNIIEVYHQRMFYDVPAKLAELDIVAETRDAAHADEIITALTARGFRTRLMGTTEASG